MGNLAWNPFEGSASNNNEFPGETCELLRYLDSYRGARTYATSLDHLGSVSVTDVDGTIVDVNDEFCRISQYTREELIGANHRIFHSGKEYALAFHNMFKEVSAGRTWRGTMRNRRKDGEYLWVNTCVVPIKKENKVIGYFSVRVDISETVELHETLRERARYLQEVVDNFPGGIALFDEDHKMVISNDHLKLMLDYPASLFEPEPPTLEKLYRFNAERGEYGEGDVEEQVRTRLELAKQNSAHVFERQRPDGTWLEIRGMPLAGGGFVTSYIDISARKENEATIKKMAMHDALTGLPNRVLMRDRLGHAMERVKRGDQIAVLYLDLDRFKSVNDTLGHPVGDALLKAVASRLSNCTRSMDTVARLGGDEFAIIQLGITGRKDIEVLASRVIDEISKPFDLGKHQVSVGTSIGISIAPIDSSDADESLKYADLALCRAKGDGRGTYNFFEEGMDEKLRVRRSLEADLRKALRNEEFELYYQPILGTGNREVVSCEALMRWQHPERGMVSAGEFIPVAEETGLVVPMGDWVMRQACKEALSWPEHVSVAVNVSAAQFRGRCLKDVVLKSLNGLDPTRLVLEITESLLMQDNETTARTLKSLRDMGIRFALDDFGTGYSSLGYLQSFPFDKIKIDRSFVMNATEQKHSETLLRTIAQLGKALGMTTVAEGVETEAHFDLIKKVGCTEAQGFLFSKPVPSEKIIEFVKTPELV